MPLLHARPGVLASARVGGRLVATERRRRPTFHWDHVHLVKFLRKFDAFCDPMYRDNAQIPIFTGLVPPENVQAAVDALEADGYWAEPPHKW